MKHMRAYLCSLVLLTCLPSPAQPAEDQQQHWKRMHESKTAGFNEFNDAKFGLFIHWGLYSQLAGEWKGEKIPGLTEWIMYHAMIPGAEAKKTRSDESLIQTMSGTSKKENPPRSLTPGDFLVYSWL